MKVKTRFKKIYQGPDDMFEAMEHTAIIVHSKHKHEYKMIPAEGMSAQRQVIGSYRHGLYINLWFFEIRFDWIVDNKDFS